MFRKILIANRGEIAVRVAKTARRMGVATVAVYSDADKDAPHVKACDEAVHIGPPAPSESYLRAERIIEAAKRTGAEAIHPGYGFLSENAAFAEALEKAGIIFIGPTAKTIRAMGSKSAAKDLMEEAGVPTTPGYQGEDQSFETFKREAARIGYPVLLKATAGGGGKGMRMVARAEDLEEGVASAAREGKSAFGDPRLLIEKYLPRARHVEVQIFGDGKGEVVHFFERDCSVQRRHQKIIEEAPAPRLPADARARLLEAGVNAGRAVDYRGAGTVEFLYDGGENVYFMEMNTRLQVEHPVSEAITGVDLVEWQLRIASGEGLPLKQAEIKENGHAFEARLYAETRTRISRRRLAIFRPCVFLQISRIDSGVAQGQTITPHYDPMIAKIITHGARARKRSRAFARRWPRRVAGWKRMRASSPRSALTLTLRAAMFQRAISMSIRKRCLQSPTRGTARLRRRSSGVIRKRRRTSQTIRGRRLSASAHQAAKSVYWIEVNGAPAIARLVEKAEGFDVTIEPNATAAIRREGGAERRAVHLLLQRRKRSAMISASRWVARSSPPPPFAMARGCAFSSARTPSTSPSLTRFRARSATTRPRS
ncbi:MAG: biotin carboxylase N-terminal domain-containing protein [Parvularculaceae bacterium]